MCPMMPVDIGRQFKFVLAWMHTDCMDRKKVSILNIVLQQIILTFFPKFVFQITGAKGIKRGTFSSIFQCNWHVDLDTQVWPPFLKMHICFFHELRVVLFLFPFSHFFGTLDRSKPLGVSRTKCANCKLPLLSLAGEWSACIVIIAWFAGFSQNCAVSVHIGNLAGAPFSVFHFCKHAKLKACSFIVAQ